MICNSNETLFYNDLLLSILASPVKFILSGSAYGLTLSPDSDIDLVAEDNAETRDFLLKLGFREAVKTDRDLFFTTRLRHQFEAVEVHLTKDLSRFQEVFRVMDEFRFHQMNHQLPKQFHPYTWKAAQLITKIRQELGELQANIGTKDIKK